MKRQMKKGLGSIAVSVLFGAAAFALPCSGAQNSARVGPRQGPYPQMQPFQMRTMQALPAQSFSMRVQPLQIQRASGAQFRLQATLTAPFPRVGPNAAAAGSSSRPGSGNGVGSSGIGSLPQFLRFDRPLMIDRGGPFQIPSRVPGGGGSGPDNGIPLPKDPTGGWGDGFKGLPSTTPWGSRRPGKGDWGDGLMGNPDGEGGPPIPDHWGNDLPDAGIRPSMGPDRGGPDGGYYGNLNQKYNPGGAADGSKGPNNGTGGPQSNSNQSAADSMHQMGASDVYVVKPGKEKETSFKVIGFVERGGEEYAILVDKDGISRVVSGPEARLVFGLEPGKEFDNPRYDYRFAPQPVEKSKTPRPDGEDGNASPREDPQLMLKLTKAADARQQGESLRPDAVLSDPVPVVNGHATSGPDAGSAARDNGLAAAGAAKAESAWRYAGKKPGSGITDPAEWQSGKIKDLAVGRIKHFEVIDPTESQAIQGALAGSQTAGGAESANQTPSVSLATGGVHVFACQDGQAGWVPLDAGDSLAHGSIVRVENASGARVNFAQSGVSSAVRWNAISSNGKHTLYRIELQP